MGAGLKSGKGNRRTRRDSNAQSSAPEADALSIRPRVLKKIDRSLGETFRIKDSYTISQLVILPNILHILQVSPDLKILRHELYRKLKTDPHDMLAESRPGLGPIRGRRSFSALHVGRRNSSTPMQSLRPLLAGQGRMSGGEVLGSPFGIPCAHRGPGNFQHCKSGCIKPHKAGVC